MRCERCQRPITAAAFSMPTGGRPLMYGPVCARKAGLIEPRAARQRRATTPATRAEDPAQMQLELIQC